MLTVEYITSGLRSLLYTNTFGVSLSLNKEITHMHLGLGFLNIPLTGLVAHQLNYYVRPPTLTSVLAKVVAIPRLI